MSSKSVRFSLSLVTGDDDPRALTELQIPCRISEITDFSEAVCEDCQAEATETSGGNCLCQSHLIFLIHPWEDAAPAFPAGVKGTLWEPA